jgi:hypothetical protein
MKGVRENGFDGINPCTTDSTSDITLPAYPENIAPCCSPLLLAFPERSCLVPPSKNPKGAIYDCRSRGDTVTESWLGDTSRQTATHRRIVYRDFACRLVGLVLLMHFTLRLHAKQ